MIADFEAALQQQVNDLQRENARLKALVKGLQECAPTSAPDFTAHSGVIPDPAGVDQTALPLHGMEMRGPDAALGPLLKAATSYKGLRALVVDDHRVNQLLAKHLLLALGFEVEVADDGEPAVLAVQTGRFDLVLMDLQMPNMDGWQATHQIRQWEQSLGSTRVAIVALTGQLESDSRENGHARGIDAYLTKPLTQQALQSALMEPVLGLQIAASSPVDRKRLLARLGQDEAALKDMVMAFRNDLRKCLNGAFQALQSQQWAVVSAQAHGLKGLLSSMTAQHAANDAHALELAARAADPLAAKVAFSKLSESAKLSFEAVQKW